MKIQSKYCFLFFLATFFSSTLQALPQFINEFHYDNAGSDIDEYVEIGGVAGSDLSGWSLEFYNGSNGSTYMTWGLSGVINDQDNGFGALSFSGSRGLQNGGNDGIALVDSLGQVVQFISYEGQLIAMNGAAQGAASLDIGIAENSSTAVGMSVQLVGSGKDEQDFIWQAGTSSFGSINSGQTFVTTIASEGLNQLPILKVPSPNTMVLGAIAFLLLSIRRIKAHVPSLGMINKRGRVT
jgi:hypothetical protein